MIWSVIVLGWFSEKTDSKTFWVFDAFVDEAGQQAHANGEIVAALQANSHLLAAEPEIFLLISSLRDALDEIGERPSRQAGTEKVPKSSSTRALLPSVSLGACDLVRPRIA